MSYTRKQIISWVESQTKYKFDELRNGVFFCRMLTIRFPQDSMRLKFNPAPVSQYDYTSNLTIMKKLLTRKGLQQNLNITTVLNSKNNYELAKWFKALIDHIIPVNSNDSHDNYSSVNLESKTNMFYKRDLVEKAKSHNVVDTPRQRLNDSVDDKRKLQSAEKPQKHIESKQKMKRLSMAKSDNCFFKQKKAYRTDLKIPMSGNKNKSKEVQNRLFETQINTQNIIQNLQSRSDLQEDTIEEMLYERALDESIQSLMKILQKVSEANKSTEHTTFESFRSALESKIFER